MSDAPEELEHDQTQVLNREGPNGTQLSSLVDRDGDLHQVPNTQQ
jgi:hypothetical protein